MNIKKEIEDFWKIHEKNTTLEFEDGKINQSPGNFNPEIRKITIRFLGLNCYYEKLINNGLTITLKAFTKIIIAHEIGHSLDDKLIPRYKKNGKILYQAYKLEKKEENKNLYLSYIKKYCSLEFFDEVRAWKIAKRILNNEVEKNQFYDVMKFCLNTYLKGFKERFELEKNDFIRKSSDICV